MAEANTSRRSAARQPSALPDDQVRAGPADRPQESAAAAVVEDYNCPICWDLLLEPVVGACGHEFCKECYTRWLARSRAYPTCPLCREVLSIVVPGISRRLAELIEATFPEKIQLRRQARELKAAAEAAAAPLPGQVNVQSPEYDEPPEPTPTADSPLLPMSDHQNLVRLLQQQHRSDSPYPGREAYARVIRPHSSGLVSPYSSHSPTASDPSSAPSPSHSYGPEPDDGPSSPFVSYSPWSSIPGYTPSAPRPVYTPSSPIGLPALFPTSPAFHADPFHAGSMYPSSADSARYSDHSPAGPGFPGSPRLSTSPTTEVAETHRRIAHAGRTPPPHTRHSPDARDTTANTDTAHDWPQLWAASPQLQASLPQPQPHRDFSRLLQTADQLAEQLQRASERLTYLTEYAGHSFARHGMAPPAPPMAPQRHMPYPPYPYAGYWETPPASLAAYSHHAAAAPHPSGPFNPMPWPGYEHYAAPAPGNSFAQSMPPPGSSFAQSMPPPGTLPFTMGSEPQAEAPRSSRQAQVAAAARNPARYRSRLPRTPPTRRWGGSSRSRA